MNFQFFLEVSARTGLNTDTLFLEADKLHYAKFLLGDKSMRSESVKSEIKDSNVNAYNKKLSLPRESSLRDKKGCCTS